LALPLFVITIFVSSGLLFLVQPMVGKMILPQLGGAPQVWNTCMVFFQAALLAGYGYTHTASTRLPVRKQIFVHLGLLIVPLIFLFVLFGRPFDFDSFNPPAGGNPIPAALWILTVVVGVPFFVVATSAPLLQKWFAQTGHPSAHDPYFLYAASNLGSLLALISYPALVEPLLGLQAQSWMWAGLFVVLALLIGACAFVVLQAPPRVLLAGTGTSSEPTVPPPPPEPAPAPAPAPASTAVTSGPRHGRGKHRGIKKGAPVYRPAPQAAPAPHVPRVEKPEELTAWRRLRWVALAAVPSSLMLGVTTYISTDISAITLFWVIPLTLYLLSFIFVFMRWPIPWADAPHFLTVLIQPAAVLLLIFFLNAHPNFSISVYILVNLIAFFLTALVCHGELAKDRPTTRHLTEFYLWMSVGGVVGGIFNALVAPVLFTGIVEYPLAIALACFLRPRVWENGWIDQTVVSAFPDLAARLNKSAEPEPATGPGRRRIQVAIPKSYPTLNYTLDVILGLGVGVVTIVCLWYIGEGRGWTRNWYNFIGYGLPLVLCLFLFGRPLRFGLAVGGVLLVTALFTSGRDSSVLAADRSYFGVLRVREEAVPLDEMEAVKYKVETGRYTYLMHGTTYHGQNYQTPQPLRRLATTYYHRKGPVGVIMERFNWFPGPMSTYWADSRLTASLIGQGATPGPLGQLVATWSEPAYATIGLGTGTMASYCRPFQHLTFYDIDKHIVNFSLPFSGAKPYFNYLHDAQERGGRIEVIMGDARLAMQQELLERSKYGVAKQSYPKRDMYYHTIIVDAFSSDAIPVHLITEEAIKMYFEKITEHGVLCVHTSNRHVDLIKPVSDVAVALGLKYRVGEDLGAPRVETGELRGLFSSEWIMLTRHEEDLPPVSEGGGRRQGGSGPNWSTPDAPFNRLWTDDYSNLLGVFRW
jgi:hypothetical protein